MSNKLIVSSLVSLALLSALPCAAELVDPIERAETHGLWLSPGIWSRHFKRDAGYREDNWGLGVQAELARDVAVNAGSFINSDRGRSHYVGAFWQPLELGYARLGVYGGAFDGYPYMRNGGWFLAAMPVASLNYGAVGVNLTLVPKYGERLHGAIAAQFLLRVR